MMAPAPGAARPAPGPRGPGPLSGPWAGGPGLSSKCQCTLLRLRTSLLTVTVMSEFVISAAARPRAGQQAVKFWSKSKGKWLFEKFTISLFTVLGDCNFHSGSVPVTVPS